MLTVKNIMKVALLILLKLNVWQYKQIAVVI